MVNTDVQKYTSDVFIYPVCKLILMIKYYLSTHNSFGGVNLKKCKESTCNDIYHMKMNRDTNV